MFRALEIPEILDAIFAETHNGLATRMRPLAALARTCRAFQELALDQLWRSQNTLHNIIRCLPTDLWEENLWQETRINPRQSRFSTHIWELLATLALNMPEHVLLPNLRVLRFWGAQAEVDFPSRCLLLNPSLRHLSWPIPITPSNLALLPILVRDCLLLTTLDASNPDSGVHPTPDLLHLQRLVLSTFTRALNHLEDITLEQPGTSTAESTEHPRFQALRNLELRISELAVAASYFSAFFNYSLDRLCISTKSLAMNSTIAALYAAVSSHVAHDTLRILEIGNPAHPLLEGLPIPAREDVPQYLVNGHALRPLFEFSNLTSLTLHAPVGFDIDDATAWLMAPAWPQLTNLYMDTATSVIHPPSLTLRGLSAFARHCPLLKRLGMVFDGRHVPPIDDTAEIRISLDYFHVGASPVYDPLSVATFISAIFGDDIAISSLVLDDEGNNTLDDWDPDAEIFEHYEMWRKVSTFMYARDEER
ncbi:hypothetical protein C8R44DRAFT_745618 [Mycena epipterygia]|nr:hypothetical protein C8R44DRAFT_745618 [Mycena epipterygia]